MRSVLKQYALGRLFLLFLAAIVAPVASHVYTQHAGTHVENQKISAADECTRPQVKQNPNKVLFITCGGFIE